MNQKFLIGAEYEYALHQAYAICGGSMSEPIVAGEDLAKLANEAHCLLGKIIDKVGPLRPKISQDDAETIRKMEQLCARLYANDDSVSISRTLYEMQDSLSYIRKEVEVESE
jgi:hypothetical protein